MQALTKFAGCNCGWLILLVFHSPVESCGWNHQIHIPDIYIIYRPPDKGRSVQNQPKLEDNVRIEDEITCHKTVVSIKDRLVMLFPQIC